MKTSQELFMCLQNSSGCVSIFVSTLKGLNKDPLLTLTENGPSILELLDHLERNVDTQEARDFIVAVFSRLEACIQAGNRCCLPSAKLSRIWSAFHSLRVDAGLRVAWTNFLLKISLPDSLHSLLALQFFVVDRLLKKLISMKNEDQTKMRMAKKLSTLTLRERSAVYNMSGNIAVKLIRRFKKEITKSPRPAEMANVRTSS